jgi:hypothetical protein
MEPICDNHVPLNVPMKLLGDRLLPDPLHWLVRAKLKHVYICVDGSCGRHFHDQIGYVGGTDVPIRTGPVCGACAKVMCRVRYNGTRRTMTCHCSDCNRTEIHKLELL